MKISGFPIVKAADETSKKTRPTKATRPTRPTHRR
jgi:hypothetical protein